MKLTNSTRWNELNGKALLHCCTWLWGCWQSRCQCAVWERCFLWSTCRWTVERDLLWSVSAAPFPVSWEGTKSWDPCLPESQASCPCSGQFLVKKNTSVAGRDNTCKRTLSERVLDLPGSIFCMLILLCWNRSASQSRSFSLTICCRQSRNRGKCAPFSKWWAKSAMATRSAMMARAANCAR